MELIAFRVETDCDFTFRIPERFVNFKLKCDHRSRIKLWALKHEYLFITIEVNVV